MFKNSEDVNKLTNPKTMNLFISALKYQLKQQELKKKNYKKLTNLFSVRVQKYDDSSSHKTDDKLKIRKCEIANKMMKQRLNRKDKLSKKVLIESDMYNSESSKYNKERFDSESETQFKFRKTISLNQKSKNTSKFIKHKFNKQVDLAKSKRYKDKFNSIDTKESYKSLERHDSNNNSTIINYYLIKNIDENEDLIFYNDEDKFQYDENYKCYYSLDHKSRIIYIKTSPKLLSSISSLINSTIVSKKTTKNISNEQSKLSPKKEDNAFQFDHESIIEKLKNIELLRKEGETIIQSEDESNSDNN
jgi:hypothetical protein